MIAAIILIVFFAFYFLIKVLNSLGQDGEQPKQSPRPKQHNQRQSSTQREIIVRTLDLPDDYEDGTFETNIAGITFHCTEADKGIFNGVIFNEYDNSYNPNAMAIVSNKKKLIGYIPEAELDDYYDWCNGLPVTCVGFIKSYKNADGNKILFGSVTAIKPCNKTFVESITADTEEEIRQNEHLSQSRI